MSGDHEGAQIINIATGTAPEPVVTPEVVVPSAAIGAAAAASARVADAIMNGRPPSPQDIAAAVASVGAAGANGGMTTVLAGVVPVPIGGMTPVGIGGITPVQIGAPRLPAPAAPQVPAGPMQPPARRAAPRGPAQPPAKPPAKKLPLDQALNKVGKRLGNALAEMIPGCGVTITLYPDPDGDGTQYHCATIIPPDAENGEVDIISEARGDIDNLGATLLAVFQDTAQQISEGE